MCYAGTRTIETERLVLRPVVAEDAQQMFDHWAGDPRVSRYMPWDTHESVEVTRRVLAGWLQDYDKGRQYVWMITLEGTPIGTLSLHNLDEKNRCCELGYCIGFSWWNRGYVTEAAAAALGYLFSNTGMYRVTAYYNAENVGSGRVMQKIGMTYEGAMRQAAVGRDGARADRCIYGILRPEYMASPSAGPLEKDFPGPTAT